MYAVSCRDTNTYEESKWWPIITEHIYIISCQFVLPIFSSISLLFSYGLTVHSQTLYSYITNSFMTLVHTFLEIYEIRIARVSSISYIYSALLVTYVADICIILTPPFRKWRQSNGHWASYFFSSKNGHQQLVVA